MKTAPSILEYLNEFSANYFEKVKQYLTDLDIEYVVDSNLVRGLDYYTHTAFEIMLDSEGFGAITTLCGGGRYNGLSEQIGGPEAPGIGYAMSIERCLAALEAEKIELPIDDSLDVYLVSLGDAAKDYTVGLLKKLRVAGISAERDYQDRKMKAQMKSADRMKAKMVAILGDDELAQGKITLKMMETSEQMEVNLTDFVHTIKGRL